MGKVYDQVKMFKAKYPGTITWFRLRSHAKVVEMHLNAAEEPIYTFAGQLNENNLDIIDTGVICVTNKRILIGQKNLIFGYNLNSITPDLYNDMQVYAGAIFGLVTIDTIKEVINISNIDKKALPEIETAISSFMMEEKKKYAPHRQEEK
ncbi:MAG: PH domain-containing protein [Bacilli bacterium]|nr:PH domain-containing protein [Bacilli bacterium]